MHQQYKFLLLLFKLSLLPMIASGCGSSDVGDVSGQVTLDGEPLEGAEVIFEPDEGRPSRATTDAEGRYTLQYTADTMGAKVGPHTVRITTAETVVGENYETTETPERVPENYNTNSKLRVEVKPGSNEYDFPLKSDE